MKLYLGSYFSGEKEDKEEREKNPLKVGVWFPKNVLFGLEKLIILFTGSVCQYIFCVNCNPLQYIQE